MFCPKCKDEFRPGFTRCGRCNVDLVHDLAQVKQESPSPAAGPPAPLRLIDYCGYLSLDDARGARDRLREVQVRSEIVVRESPDAALHQPVREEYWLRVDASCLRKIAEILGDIPRAEEADTASESDFACGDCGQQVAEDESFCPKCGARFDD
jgi:hypothetical protein